jgi:integrase
MNEKNTQTRALVLTLRDSGLRLGDVISLDYGDLRDGLESKDDFFYISTLTDKTHTQAQTVLGYDSLNALREWIRIRRARGHVFNEKTPIFIQERLTYSETRNTTNDIVAYERKISEMRTILTNASNKIVRFFKRAGFKGVSAHGLRKLHSSYLSVGEDRLSEPMIARLEGRIISDSREAYKLYTPGQIIEAYSKGYHLLRGEGDTRTLEAQQKQIEEMRSQLEQMQTILNDQGLINLMQLYKKSDPTITPSEILQEAEILEEQDKIMQKILDEESKKKRRES